MIMTMRFQEAGGAASIYSELNAVLRRQAAGQP